MPIIKKDEVTGAIHFIPTKEEIAMSQLKDQIEELKDTVSKLQKRLDKLEAPKAKRKEGVKDE